MYIKYMIAFYWLSFVNAMATFDIPHTDYLLYLPLVFQI